MIIKRPEKLNQSAYYVKYIDAAKQDNLFASFETSNHETLTLIGSLTKMQSNHRYAEGKWTVKQVLQHIIDCERVLSDRAFRISRFDKSNQQGFEEDSYAANDNSEKLELDTIQHEFEAVRGSTVMLFKNMNSDFYDLSGTASGLSLTPRILGWKISGHNTYHLNKIKELYL